MFFAALAESLPAVTACRTAATSGLDSEDILDMIAPAQFCAGGASRCAAGPAGVGVHCAKIILPLKGRWTAEIARNALQTIRKDSPPTPDCDLKLLSSARPMDRAEPHNHPGFRYISDRNGILLTCQ